jgi:glycosyltransferase involved in cell wall biosynthesis
MALLEAAACGLPWISPPVGAAADLAHAHPASGWPVPPRDPAALGRAILAAADVTARQARGAAARAAVVHDYALETQTDRLLAHYTRLAGRSAHG